MLILAMKFYILVVFLIKIDSLKGLYNIFCNVTSLYSHLFRITGAVLNYFPFFSISFLIFHFYSCFIMQILSTSSECVLNYIWLESSLISIHIVQLV